MYALALMLLYALVVLPVVAALLLAWVVLLPVGVLIVLVAATVQFLGAARAVRS